MRASKEGRHGSRQGRLGFHSKPPWEPRATGKKNGERFVLSIAIFLVCFGMIFQLPPQLFGRLSGKRSQAANDAKPVSFRSGNRCQAAGLSRSHPGLFRSHPGLSRSHPFVRSVFFFFSLSSRGAGEGLGPAPLDDFLCSPFQRETFPSRKRCEAGVVPKRQSMPSCRPLTEPPGPLTEPSGPLTEPSGPLTEPSVRIFLKGNILAFILKEMKKKEKKRATM